VKVHEVQCDGCGKRKAMDATTETKWLTVATAVSPDEYAAVMAKLEEGQELQNVIDNGDFCGLVCLANWASARASLRMLDE